MCGDGSKLQHVVHLMDWVKQHTLNIVLSGDWKQHKDTYEANLLYEVEACEKELNKLNNSFSLHCKKLAKVIQDPWGNEVLNKLITTDDPTVAQEGSYLTQLFLSFI